MCLYIHRYCFGLSFYGKAHGAKVTGQYKPHPGWWVLPLPWSALQRIAKVCSTLIHPHSRLWILVTSSRYIRYWLQLGTNKSITISRPNVRGIQHNVGRVSIALLYDCERGFQATLQICIWCMRASNMPQSEYACCALATRGMGSKYNTATTDLILEWWQVQVAQLIH